MPPSWTDQVQAMCAIVGVVIALTGFIFVSYQVFQINRTTRGTAHAAVFSHYLELTKHVAEHPEVRPYLYDGKPWDNIESPRDRESSNDKEELRSRVLIACELFGDFYEHVALQKENLPYASCECWEKAIADRYHKNPVLRAFIDARERVYAAALFRAIERGTRLLNRSPSRK